MLKNERKNSFENLEVWKVSHELTIQVYRLTKTFPIEERFRLVDQLCRSASSVPANIVEGNSRGHKKEHIQYLYQARGSLEETKYHLLLAKDLKYLNTAEYVKLIDLCEKTGRLLSGLLKYLIS